jgi:hypothetical protein
VNFYLRFPLFIYHLAEILYKSVSMTLLRTCDWMKIFEVDEVFFLTCVSKIKFRLVRETVRHFGSKERLYKDYMLYD